MVSLVFLEVNKEGRLASKKVNGFGIKFAVGVQNLKVCIIFSNRNIFQQVFTLNGFQQSCSQEMIVTDLMSSQEGYNLPQEFKLSIWF